MFGDILQPGANDQSASSSSAERREHVRQVIKLRVLVAVGQTILQGRTENISAGGACIFLDQMLGEGTDIAVRFLTPHLPKFQHIDVAARVQYGTVTSGHPSCRIGVKFVGVDAESRRRLTQLIGE